MRTISGFITSIFFLLLLAAPVLSADWLRVTPGQVVRVPEHIYFQKGYRVQWWYFTGHLFDETGREFGYELTFFAAGVQQKEYQSEFGVNLIFLSHFAVSDVVENRFYHHSNADSGAYGFAGADVKRLRVRVGKSFVKGNAQKMQIRGQARDLDLNLLLVPAKPVVLHGKNGYSRKSAESPLIASLYFSFTDIESTGSLKIGEKTFKVRGKSWFDREIASKGLPEAGWDWFSVKLDDDREIMLYEIRNRDGKTDPFSSGTVVYKNGTYRHLRKKDFTVKILDRYTSKHTKAIYPSKWEVTIPSEELTLMITPLIKDQEFTGGGAIRTVYWEGTCRVEGTVQGRAYVEMTGYDKGSFQF